MTVCVRSWGIRVRHLKAQISGGQRAAAEMQRLVFAGNQLAYDACTLAAYGVGEGSTPRPPAWRNAG